MADVQIQWDMAKLGRFCAMAPETFDAIDAAVKRTAATADSMSAGNVTGSYHRDHKSPHVGGTAPVYGSNTQLMDNSAVGIAYTGNYAAKKDNLQNNTLFSALG